MANNRLILSSLEIKALKMLPDSGLNFEESSRMLLIFEVKFDFLRITIEFPVSAFNITMLGSFFKVLRVFTHIFIQKIVVRSKGVVGLAG